MQAQVAICNYYYEFLSYHTECSYRAVLIELSSYFLTNNNGKLSYVAVARFHSVSHNYDRPSDHNKVSIN